MPTVLDIMREKRIPAYVYTDIKKTDGTALYLWKQRNGKFLDKTSRNFEDKVLELIDFPPQFTRTLSSIVQFHFDRKMNGGKVPWKKELEEERNKQREERIKERRAKHYSEQEQDDDEMALIQKATRENMQAETELLTTSDTFVDVDKEKKNNQNRRRRIVRRRNKTNRSTPNADPNFNNFNNY